MIRRTGFLSFALVFFAGAVCFAAGPAGRSDVADAAMKRDRAALRALIQQKADVNAPQVDGATAMHWAVYNDDVESADLLIKAGAKADTENREGITPLHLASQYGNAAMIDRLIKAGADACRRNHGHACGAKRQSPGCPFARGWRRRCQREGTHSRNNRADVGS